MGARIFFAILVALPAWAEAGRAASPPTPRERPLSISRFLAVLQEEGEIIPEKEGERDLGDLVERDEETREEYERRQRRIAEAKRHRDATYQAIDQYAAKKLTNLRFSFAIFNMVYHVMKEGSAGVGHYDDLFQENAVLSRVHLGGTSVWVPTGGFEIDFVAAPFYHILVGLSYDIFTGRHFMGNEFNDLLITRYYLGLRFNLLNEYVATQKFAEMFEYSAPPHIPGLNVYLKAHVGFAVVNRVLMKGPLAGPGDNVDTYFNQTATFGYFLGAGFEYRIATVGFFVEGGWSYIRHPRVTEPNVEVNHFRSFPIMAGLNIYFGG
ncbi:MAG: hypothetical protein ACYS47_05920 [Planctomycetota bacterium]|jgi:hypothetical protein